ncbi:MAG TPA: Tad domain-containing protein, partial [Caulobacteraceae bacterium]
WAALVAPPLIGAFALALDVARVYSLEAELQTAADSLARASAVELDGNPDAITRATAAIANLVENRQTLATRGHSEVVVGGLRFFSSLPASDDAPITSAYETTNPNAARFVEVAIKPEAVRTIFPPSMAQGLVSVSLSAKAVGGRVKRMCGAAPLFICNPFEGSGQSLEAALKDRTVRGRLVAFKSKGTEATYFPGNFGYLEPPGGNGANELRDMFAKVNPGACYDAAGVVLRTGAVNSAGQGLNVRFDIYEGSFKGSKNDPAFAPAVNVTKGWSGANCNNAPNASAMGLPRDNCFATGNCPHMSGRMGDGTWNVAAYMKVNHGSPASAVIGGVTYTFNYASNTVTPATPPTRYEVYRWEITNGKIPGTSGYTASTTPENGAPQCYSGGTPSDTPDRRLLPVAVIDCQALDDAYDLNGGSTPPLPVRGFVKVFLTEPMGGSEDTIWGEIVGMVEWGVDVVARDQVEVRR